MVRKVVVIMLLMMSVLMVCLLVVLVLELIVRGMMLKVNVSEVIRIGCRCMW